MVGFYRIYEIENNEVYIVSTYLEDDEEYHMIAEYVVNYDFSFLEKMRKGHSQESPVLRWPLKDGDTLGKAVVVDTDRPSSLMGRNTKRLWFVIMVWEKNLQNIIMPKIMVLSGWY